MRRQAFLVLLLISLGFFSACGGAFTSISPEDVATTPTVYASVVNPPNPLLLGHYRRSAPSEINHPWTFNYWLVKSGDKYAVYYVYDSHTKNSFKGWADFTLDVNRVTSKVDGVSFYVDGDEVRMSYPGRTETYHMMKVDQ